MLKKNEPSKLPQLEIVMGIIAPIGCEKDSFIELISKEFKDKNYDFKIIKITDCLKSVGIQPNHDLANEKSLSYFERMDACSQLRQDYSGGIFLLSVIEKIKKERKQIEKMKTDGIVYLIDQLKNTTEYKVLSHIYGLNYVQISLFSSYTKRNTALENKFDTDHLESLFKKRNQEFGITCEISKRKNTVRVKLTDYEKILKDTSHSLMEKDSEDTTEEFCETNSGQQVSKLFHKSDYFFNLDSSESDRINEVKKFCSLIQGEYVEHPTQDEFGMSLAYTASFRSNFPGERQIGAALLSKYGEVISVASIRAPTGSSNPNYNDEMNVKPGYDEFHKKVHDKKNGWIKKVEDSKLGDDLKKFLKNNLDYHPCTHAEIAAILDAAKLGVSTRNATLYSTTFPCHICAKDIISAGIERVVYLEAYPKSKNKELYPGLIDVDGSKSSRIPFDFYAGISPERFTYMYSLDNKRNEDKQGNNKTKKILPPILKFEFPKYYEAREEDVQKYLNDVWKNRHRPTTLSFLDDLLSKPTTKK